MVASVGCKARIISASIGRFSLDRKNASSVQSATVARSSRTACGRHGYAARTTPLLSVQAFDFRLVTIADAPVPVETVPWHT